MFFHLFFCKISIFSYILVLLIVLKYLYSVKGCTRYHVARLLYYSGLMLAGMMCIPLFLFSPGNVKNSMFFGRYVGRYFSYFYGVTWNLKGERHLSENKEGVIVANHQHELDLIGMFNFWDVMGDTAVIAKREIFWSPFGIAAWIAGVVFIDRANPETSRKTLNHSASVLKKNTKIFIFPEGTRNWNLKKFLPFKKGAFHIAIEAQAPIIPVLFSPYYFLDTKRKILDLGGQIFVSVLPPISTVGLTLKDLDRLILDVREKMEYEYQKLYEEVKENVVSKLESEEKRSRFLKRLEETN